MGWVAGKAIEVMRGGKPVKLKPGDPVPEAATWRNLSKEIAWKRIVDEAEWKPKAEAQAKAEAEAQAQARAQAEAAPAVAEDSGSGDSDAENEEERPKRRGAKKKR